MKRKDFLSKGAFGLLSTAAIATGLSSCGEDPEDPAVCETTPEEIIGPFPIKSPADLVRGNIVGNRTGVPMAMFFTIQDSSNGCSPMADVFVDVWQCDAQGNYSEYDRQVDGDFTGENFLRGRQTTNDDGIVMFVSIYPGWYPGRTPHIHLEVLNSNGDSLLATQVAFPDTVSDTVYATPGYNGTADTNNAADDFLTIENIADSLTGNTTDGYTLRKTIVV